MCDEIIYIMNNFYTQKILIVFFSERFIALERQTVHLWLHPISVLRLSELTDIQTLNKMRHLTATMTADAPIPVRLAAVTEFWWDRHIIYVTHFLCDDESSWTSSLRLKEAQRGIYVRLNQKCEVLWLIKWEISFEFVKTIH